MMTAERRLVTDRQTDAGRHRDTAYITLAQGQFGSVFPAITV